MVRTRQDVIEERGTVHGCCSRFVDRVPCDCFERAAPDAAPCLTPSEVDGIEAKTARLYSLYNACAKAGCSCGSDPAVRRLVEHLNEHFPGKHILQLVAEVRFLQARVVELTGGTVQPEEP